MPEFRRVCKAKLLIGRHGARAGHADITRLFVCAIVSSADNERMPDHVYKKIEIVGSSPNGFEEAVKNALVRAQKTIRNMRWFEVTETRGCIDEGKVAEWQVTLKIGFTLEE